MWRAMSKRSLGLTDLTPSTPAVFLPGFPVSPVVLRVIARLPISLRVFGVCELLVDYHADWLGRYAFGCGSSVALVSSRAHGSKPHSSGLSVLAVLSYLSSD